MKPNPELAVATQEVTNYDWADFYLDSYNEGKITLEAAHALYLRKLDDEPV